MLITLNFNETLIWTAARLMIVCWCCHSNKVKAKPGSHANGIAFTSHTGRIG